MTRCNKYRWINNTDDWEDWIKGRRTTVHSEYVVYLLSIHLEYCYLVFCLCLFPGVEAGKTERGKSATLCS